MELTDIMYMKVPAMRKYGLYVTSLEKSFLNRALSGTDSTPARFPARSSVPVHGLRLLFEHVQMVIMHELAHCKTRRELFRRQNPAFLEEPH